MTEETKELDPQDYFEYVKSMKDHMTDDFLVKLHKVIMKQLSKAMITGQNLQVRRLAYSLGILKREHELLELGIDTFVLRQDIETFINDVADKAVKVTELEFFPREIPDELFETIKMLKEKKLFDNFYVIHTDYTGEVTKNVDKARRRKDPILFGVFEQKIDDMWNIYDRFYFIGDWEDEYCDLTLTKMVQEMSKKGIEITNKVAIVEPSEKEIKSYVNCLIEDDKNRFHLGARKQPLFKRVKSAWKLITNG